jgi:uncharacterized damage-inducible protein DinB
MASDLVEAWRMGNEVNLFLIDHLDTAWLKDRYSPRTRSVAAQLAHIHNVRLRWIEHAAPELAAGAERFPRGAEPTKAQLRKALRASGQAVGRFLEASEETGRVKQWKGSPATFLAYLVAHEAHHRGLAMVAMRLSGHKLPREVVYGQWDWGKKRSLR